MTDNIIDLNRSRLELMVARMFEEAALKAARIRTPEELDYEARYAAHQQAHYDALQAAEQAKAEQEASEAAEEDRRPIQDMFFTY